MRIGILKTDQYEPQNTLLAFEDYFFCKGSSN